MTQHSVKNSGESMTSSNTLDFASAQADITTENIKAHASEIHGVLTGLVCAGFPVEDLNYLTMINDLFNNGEGLPSKVKSTVKQMFSELWTDILDDAYTFQLMLPDDDDSIAERGHALGVWVQGFNLGFGLQQKDSPVVSEEVKEVLTDFAEIANLSDEMEEGEATEQAYFEINEYVRISALLCFSELGTLSTKANDDKQENSTIH
jgi:yecA family protein